jgi:hypothetical protein
MLAVFYVSMHCDLGVDTVKDNQGSVSDTGDDVPDICLS